MRYRSRQIARSRRNQEFAAFDESLFSQSRRRARYFYRRYFRPTMLGSGVSAARKIFRRENSIYPRPLRGNTDRLGVPYSSSNDRNSSASLLILHPFGSPGFPRRYTHLLSYSRRFLAFSRVFREAPLVCTRPPGISDTDAHALSQFLSRE